jgi:hypothetical protein
VMAATVGMQGATNPGGNGRCLLLRHNIGRHLRAKHSSYNPRSEWAKAASLTSCRNASVLDIRAAEFL